MWVRATAGRKALITGCAKLQGTSLLVGASVGRMKDRTADPPLSLSGSPSRLDVSLLNPLFSPYFRGCPTRASADLEPSAIAEPPSPACPSRVARGAALRPATPPANVGCCDFASTLSPSRPSLCTEAVRTPLQLPESNAPSALPSLLDAAVRTRPDSSAAVCVSWPAVSVSLTGLPPSTLANLLGGTSCSFSLTMCAPFAPAAARSDTRACSSVT